MRIFLTALAGVMTVGSAAFCEPPKAAPGPAQMPQRGGPVLLASADLQSPARPTAEPTPAKHRIVRVTKCRCGDPPPSSETPED